jgi:hypothetical protein
MDYNAILENLDSIPLEILKKINNYYQNKYNKTINYDYKAHNAQYHQLMKDDPHYKAQKAEHAKKQNAIKKQNRIPKIRTTLTDEEKKANRIIANKKYFDKKTLLLQQKII